MKTSEITKLTTWNMDQAHSSIQFSVSHMIISQLVGHFRKFEGKVTMEDNQFETAKISVTIDATSIDTNHEQRDNHLISAEFLNTGKYPTITFESTGIRKVDETNFIIKGNLTINGITKEIEIGVQYNGTIKDPYNNIRAGFEAKTGINRKDFGVNWLAFLDSGGLVAGENVKITTHAEIVKKDQE